jgi:hypothetical protein
MGGTSSKNISEQINEEITKNIQEVLTQCVSEASSSQLIRLREIKGDVVIRNVSQTVSSSINMDCLKSEQVKKEIVSSFISSVDQYGKAKGIAGLSLLSNTNVENKQQLESRLLDEYNKNESNISQSISSTFQNLTAAKIDGNLTMENVSQEASTDLVSKLIVKSSVFQNAIKSASSTVKSEGSAESVNPLQFLADMVGSFATMWGFIFAVLIIGFFIFVYLSSRSGSGGNTPAIETVGGDSKK